MKKLVVAIDVDEVMLPFVENFVRHYNRHYDPNLRFEDFNGFYWESILGVDTPRIRELIQEHIKTPEHFNQEPMTGSIKALQQLKQKYDLVIITARHNFSREMTHEWFEKHFPTTFRGIHFVRDPKDNNILVPKSEICHKVGATILIDDGLHNIEECAARGIRSLLFGDYPWNQAESLPKGVQRVKNWDEVLEELL